MGKNINKTETMRHTTVQKLDSDPSVATLSDFLWRVKIGANNNCHIFRYVLFSISGTYYLCFFVQQLMDIFCRLLLLFAKLLRNCFFPALFDSLHMLPRSIYCIFEFRCTRQV